MKSKQLGFSRGFRVAIDDKRAQAAQMTIAPGGKEGGPDNRHHGADQWLFVVSGKGEAVVNGKKSPLSRGTLLLIERGDFHEIRNTSKSPLRTLSIYTPPAYSKDGEELPAGKK